MLPRLSSLNNLLLLILPLSFFSSTITAALPSNIHYTHTSPPLTRVGHVKRGGPPNKDAQLYVPPHLRNSSPPLAMPGSQTLPVPRIDNSHYTPTPNFGSTAQQPEGRGGGIYGPHWKKDPRKILVTPATFSQPLNNPESFLREPQSNSDKSVNTGGDWRFTDSGFPAMNMRRFFTVPRRKPLPGSREHEATKSEGQRGKTRMIPAMEYPKLRSASADPFQGRPGGGRSALGERRGTKLVDLSRNLPKARVLSTTQYQPSPISNALKWMDSSERSGPKPVDPSKKEMSTAAITNTKPPPPSGPLPQAEGPSFGADVRAANSLQDLHPKSRLHKWISSRRIEGGDAKLGKRTPISTTASPSDALPHPEEQLSTAADIRAPNLLEDLPPKSRLHKWMSSGSGRAEQEPARRKQMAISTTASASAVLSHHTELSPDIPAKSILHDLPATSRLHKWRNSGSSSGKESLEHSERTADGGNLPRNPPPRHV